MKRCRTCGEPKPTTDYLRGPKGGVGRSCVPCLEAAAWGMNERRRFATTWEVEGVSWRRCTRCGTDKPLEAGFFRLRSKDGTLRYLGECKPCKVQRGRETQARRKADPKTAAKIRKEWARRQREYARLYPERTKAARKRAYERLRKDRQAYARNRELGRMNHRLRRERQGLPVRPPESLPRKVIRVSGRERRTLPALPLAEVIRKASNGDSTVATCRRLGVSDRSYREWITGRIQVVQLAVAERVLHAAGLQMWDVYPTSESAMLPGPTERGF